jgi:hypothetical protein
LVQAVVLAVAIVRLAALVEIRYLVHLLLLKAAAVAGLAKDILQPKAAPVAVVGVIIRAVLVVLFGLLVPVVMVATAVMLRE